MAEYLIYNKENWYDLATPERQAEVNLDGKFDSRFIKGDIAEIREDGYFLNSDDSIALNWDRGAFCIVKTTDETTEQASLIKKLWRRTFSYKLDSLDDVNGIYDYTITLINPSLSGKELFSIRDRFLNLPSRLSLLEKQPGFIKLRLTLPSGWSQEYKDEVRTEFQHTGKDKLFQLAKPIMMSQYYIDLNAIPQSYKDQIASVGWIKGTVAQLQSYIINKAE